MKYINKVDMSKPVSEMRETMLSPEQRHTFDKGFNFEHHGRFGKESWKK
jgi:hypothetical protein